MTRICSFDGCGRKLTPHSARGLCTGHYQQWAKGWELAPLQPRNFMLPWVYAHLGYDGDDCLTWPFARNNQGRGSVKWKRKNVLAHRLMCLLAHGPAPEGKPQATHSCGKGHLGCVNPRHLRWGSDKDNKFDMIAHGTRPWGERQGSSKLTTSDVIAIRQMAAERSQSQIAAEFGVAQSTISKIYRGERWGHI